MTTNIYVSHLRYINNDEMRFLIYNVNLNHFCFKLQKWIYLVFEDCKRKVIKNQQI